MDRSVLDTRKAKARAWFEALRDDICAAIEGLEDALPANAPFADRRAGSLSVPPGGAPIMGVHNQSAT